MSRTKSFSKSQSPNILSSDSRTTDASVLHGSISLENPNRKRRASIDGSVVSLLPSTSTSSSNRTHLLGPTTFNLSNYMSTLIQKAPEATEVLYSKLANPIEEIFYPIVEVPEVYHAIKEDIDERLQKEGVIVNKGPDNGAGLLVKTEKKPEFEIVVDIKDLKTEEKKETKPTSPEVSKEKDKDKRVKANYEVEEHNFPLSEISHKFGTQIDYENLSNSQGMSQEAAAERLARDGRNILKPPKSLPWFIKFFLHFTNLFMILLEVAGILCFIAYGIDSSQRLNLYLGGVLWAIVILTCIISYLQERQSSNIMNSFKGLLPQSTSVIRGGLKSRIPAEDLVVGDIVFVQAGDKIPADIRIIICNGMKVDNSSLTGENEPIACRIECTNPNPLETHNLAFYGTLAMDGQAYGVVIRTGGNTLIGKIADLASSTAAGETTLQKEIKRFVRFISILGVTMGLVFFFIGIGTHMAMLPNLINVLGIIVANIPEGLPSTVTACLTVTAKRLAKRNVFVKQLEAVETLGSITLIASDKTGTLTKNKMTVNHCFYDLEIFSCASNGTLGRSVFDYNSLTCSSLLRCAAVCNRADFDKLATGNLDLPIDSRLILGDASESALVRLCEKIFPISVKRADYPKIFEIPFNSVNKWQLSIHKQFPQQELQITSSQRILLMKGAPEIIFSRCDKILLNGKEVYITDELQRNFMVAYESLGSMGERVLGFAELYLDPVKYGPHYDALYDASALNFPTTGLTFIGLCSLLDPPRESVPFAVSQCKTAGIKVMMVTGDHPITAQAIAKKVGIISGETKDDVSKRLGIPMDEVDESMVEAVVVHGERISDLTEDEWDLILSKKGVVFARTSPQQKSIIVEKCQARKEVVAVTGDGVNDSPALKKADIGVAMGIVGSDVAKETADVILLDDNFVSIVAGVEEGRIIFDNLKKSIAYTLSHAIPEISPFIVSIIFGIPLALSSVLILPIDLGTELAPAISLAYEPGESNIMQRKPRKIGVDHLVTKNLLLYSYCIAGVIEMLACFISYFVVMSRNGFHPKDLLWVANTGSPYFDVGAPPLVIDGQVYDANDQLKALSQAQTAYFMSVVVCQMFNIIACKTRVMPTFKHGFKNRFLNFGLLIEISICILIVYLPPLNYVFESQRLWVVYWLVPIPLAIFLFAQNELRKWFIRKFPESKLTKMVLGW